jgi:hypothetical protein
MEKPKKSFHRNAQLRFTEFIGHALSMRWRKFAGQPEIGEAPSLGPMSTVTVGVTTFREFS